MSDLAPLVARFPAQEFALRRLCTRDAAFRAICEDHAAAAAALLRFEDAEPANVQRVEEYRGLIQEIEAEITAILAVNEPAARQNEPQGYHPPGD